MAQAFATGVTAGRQAFESGLMAASAVASATSPLTSFLGS
jgi:thiazole synthase ThiGH ThiG subunit